MNSKLPLIAVLAAVAAGSAEAAPFGSAPVPGDLNIQPVGRYIYDDWRHPRDHWPPGYQWPRIWRERQFRSDDPVFHGR